MQIKEMAGVSIVFIIIITVIIIILQKTGINPQSNTPTPEPDTLKLVSIKPDPLDNATVLPNLAIEVSFNKPILTGELKHRFEPQMEVNIEPLDKLTPKGASKFKITFKKPLELGKNYTLFILSNTHTEDGLELGQEHRFRFKTIDYRGV